MYRLSFLLALFGTPAILFIGGNLESKMKIYQPIGVFFPSEMASIAVFIILVFGPIIHWIVAAKRERLAARNHQELLEAMFRLETEMISKKAAQVLRLRMELLEDVVFPQEGPPKPPKNKGGRPKKPMCPELDRALTLAGFPSKPTVH